MRLRPAQIADVLCAQHHLNEVVCNRQSIEEKIRYLKKNKLAKFAPVNQEIDIQVTTGQFPSTCNFFFFFFFFN